MPRRSVSMLRSSRLMTNLPEMPRVPAERRAPLSYLDLYGLSKPPFGTSFDSNDGYTLFASHRRDFELVINTMINGSGLIVLYGEAGVGKTRMLHAAGDAALGAGLPTRRIGRPPDGRVTLDEMMDSLKSLHASDGSIRDIVETFAAPPRKVLLVDDVDLMPEDCIDVLLRMLRRCPAGTGTSTIVVTSTAEPLAGALGQIAHATVRLSRLGPAEVRAYIEQALWVAGGTTRRIITPQALRLIVTQSNGLPGSVNRMMEASFIAGFARGEGVLTARTVASVTGPRQRWTSRLGSWTAGLVPIIAAILLVGGASAFLYKGLRGSAPAGAPRPVEAAPKTDSGSLAVPREKPMDANLIAALMKRGEQSLALGDIAAARLVFLHAAEAGHAAAATAMGMTYDPNFRSSEAARAERPDPTLAAAWYHKAIALGDPHAAELLQRLGLRE